MPVEIQKTGDGSHTLFIPEMNETYHSIHGAVNESLHVFIKNGFLASNARPVKILEVGFGTGLNAWLTLIEAGKQQIKVQYTGYEFYPLPDDMLRALNYPSMLDDQFRDEFYQLHKISWDGAADITPFFSLEKKKEDLTIASVECKFDVIYFDAFAPEKQPEMWTPAVYSKMYNALLPGGILVTYCAKGEVRRSLGAAGFAMEKLAGPPGGKREMLRGRK